MKTQQTALKLLTLTALIAIGVFSSPARAEIGECGYEALTRVHARKQVEATPTAQVSAAPDWCRSSCATHKVWDTNPDGTQSTTCFYQITSCTAKTYNAETNECTSTEPKITEVPSVRCNR